MELLERTTRKTRNAPARKLNRRLAIMQAKRGMSNHDIAKVQGVSHTTIGRFMARIQPERAALQGFKDQRADVLATIQAQTLEVQQKLLRELGDRDLTALTAGQISSMIIALNAQHGTTFDKERLERGQSTSNQSIVSKLIDSELRDLYRKPALVAPVALPVEERSQLPAPATTGGILAETSEKRPAGGKSNRTTMTRPPAPRATQKKPR